MRPAILETYQPIAIKRIRLWIMKMFLGDGSLDAARAAFYRSDLFMTPYYLLQHKILHQGSEWSIAERELFGACVAAKVHCEFCRVVHSGVASHARKQQGWASSILEHGTSSTANSKIAAIIPFIEKLAEQPWNVTQFDIAQLYDAGLTAREIEEAAMVCIVFSIGVRVASALGFKTPSAEDLDRSAPLVLQFGYRVFA